MASINFIFNMPNVGRSITDAGWETVEPAHVATWEAATTLLRKHYVQTKDGTFCIEIDWTTAAKRIRRYYTVLKYLLGPSKETADQSSRKARFPQRASRIPIKATVEGIEKLTLAQLGMSANVIECVLYDVFLIMNITAPGCCDFYRSSLTGVSRTHNIDLSGSRFETALLVHLHHGWPISQTLDLSTVSSWFRSVRHTPLQLPHNPMEKVLFALLHMAQVEMSPMIVIWLFYAFESLFQTHVGENISALNRRLGLLLDADAKQSVILRKQVRALYNIRSAIVHGGFEVAHPCHNEQLDRRVDDNFERILSASDFGIALLMAAIQKIIANSWRMPKFDEVLSGDPVS